MLDDTQRLHVDHENLVDEAIFPLRCFSGMMSDLNQHGVTVCPVEAGVALKALVEKCAADLITAMDAAGQAHTSDA